MARDLAKHDQVPINIKTAVDPISKQLKPNIHAGFHGFSLTAEQFQMGESEIAGNSLWDNNLLDFANFNFGF